MFDEEGNYLSYLPLTGSPWNVAISNQNIAYVTMTTDREQCILQVDPDKLCIFVKTVFGDSSKSICCVSSAMSMKQSAYTYLGYMSEYSASCVKLFNGGAYCK